MKAMLLAAGRGERLRPLTDTTPKPLLMVQGKPLIVHHLEALVAAHITDIVINVSHLAELVIACLGDGKEWGVSITYSHEPEALEWGGGVLQALPFLGQDHFLVVSGDIWTDYPFATLIHKTMQNRAHCVLVDNPPYHLAGDYHLTDNGLLSREGAPKWNYSGIGLYHPDLFQGIAQNKKIRFSEILNPAIDREEVTGEHYPGRWVNVGTIEDLTQAQECVTHVI